MDIFSSTDPLVYRLLFNEDELEIIQLKESESFKDLGTRDKVHIWPSSQYLQDMSDLDPILVAITKEMEARVLELKKAGKELEAHRIQKRVSYDVRMIKETGFVNGCVVPTAYFGLPKLIPSTASAQIQSLWSVFSQSSLFVTETQSCHLFTLHAATEYSPALENIRLLHVE